MDFRLVNGTSSKWCSQYVYINGGFDYDYENTKKVPYCIEHGSGQWVISMDDPEDWHGSGYQPVYKSTKNVTCPTEINYDEWENNLHYEWHRAQDNMLTCQGGPKPGMLQSILQLIHGQEFSYSVLLHSCTR